mgnify:CR=1 FL=1
MINIHSDAYNEFVQKINADGYMQGYNDKLFELILPQERDEIEQIVEERFAKGDYEMTVFMPKLSKINGISKLQEAAKKLKRTCSAYCEIMYVLYTVTQKESYLDELIQILKSSNEDERMNAIMRLLRCGKNKKLYEVYKEQCIIDEDEDVRSRCVIGMLYCKDIIKNPFIIQPLEQPWKRLKLEMYDADKNKEDRIKAIQEFEELLH